MLSISNVSNGAGASSYYEQADDYYSQDRSPSLWSGKASAMLGLTGEVIAEDFRAMLDGRLPNGAQIPHSGKHRGGTDLTFSAPKSVSIQVMIGGDKRLLAAHETALCRALEYVESIASCRVSDHGVVRKISTGNLAIAQFRHDLSRSADPQLHTHCVILNLTQRADGQWRAVDNEPFYRHKMLLGAYYRSELAKEVQALGYGIRVTNPDGRFELSHIEPAQIKTFSTRALAIEESLKKRGLSRSNASARLLQIAALDTRQRKTDLDRAILASEWQHRAHEAGINFNHDGSAQHFGTQYLTEAAKAVAYAIKHLSEREAVLRENDIVRFSLERGVGKTDLASIRSALLQAVETGEVIQSGDRYTTPTALQQEREILDIEQSSRNKVLALMGHEEFIPILDATSLNTGQNQAVQLVLTTRNQIIGIQGWAGTGKTTALRVIRAILESRDVQVIGLAPSAGAAQELASSGIQSQTLAAFSTSQYQGLNSNTLIVLDEASMISARDMHALLKEAESAHARVLLVGDIGQLAAIDAGKPFFQLQQAGMETARLDEIQRQKNLVLKEAVELAAEGAVYSSLQKLHTQIVEIEYHRERHKQIATDYAALSLEERKTALIVSGTKNNRLAINAKVREVLGISGCGEIYRMLSRKDMSEAEALRTVSYQYGDVVRADRNYKSLGLKRGDLANVIEGRPGFVTLKRLDGEILEWRPTNQLHFSVYSQRESELAPSDLVRFTENDYRRGIVNGDLGTVIECRADRVLVEKADGKRIALDASQPLRLDYGYCQTIHAAQGKTCDRVLIEAEAISAAAHESAYYVAISRARHEVTIYTDSRELLPEAMSRTLSKSAALDISLHANGRENTLNFEVGE